MQIVIVMGVCGSGKTTVGVALAKLLGCGFEDGDQWHPKPNTDKMSRGIPLSDEDRLPWLEALHGVLVEWARLDKKGVLACSSLKKSYQDILTGRGTDTDVTRSCVFVVLLGSEEVIRERLCLREEHFMPASLLQSQLDILEVPDGESSKVIICNCADSVEKVVEQVMQGLSTSNEHQSITL